MRIFSARVTDKANVNIYTRSVGKDRWAARTTVLSCPSFVPTANTHGEWWPDSSDD